MIGEAEKDCRTKSATKYFFSDPHPLKKNKSPSRPGSNQDCKMEAQVPAQ